MIKFKKIGPEVRARLSSLPRMFSRYPAVIVVYLFGSYAKGDVKPLSDIDIAYLLDPHASGDYLDQDLDLQVAISSALGTDEVDCHLLNKASLQLQYEVVTTGKAIYCRDRATKERFETTVREAYEQRKEEFIVTKAKLLKAFEE